MTRTKINYPFVTHQAINHPFVTSHAIKRFQEHHPGASRDSVLEYIRYGSTLNPNVVQVMLERTYVKVGTTYILSPDHRGVFVLSPNRCRWQSEQLAVVTYLRLSQKDQETAQVLWPVAA